MLGTVGEAAHDGAREILEAATTTKELALEGAET